MTWRSGQELLWITTVQLSELSDKKTVACEFGWAFEVCWMQIQIRRYSNGSEMEREASRFPLFGSEQLPLQFRMNLHQNGKFSFQIQDQDVVSQTSFLKIQWIRLDMIWILQILLTYFHYFIATNLIKEESLNEMFCIFWQKYQQDTEILLKPQHLYRIIVYNLWLKLITC